MKVEVLGCTWCEDTERTRDLLDKVGIIYEFVDLDKCPEDEKRAASYNNGVCRTPTVIFHNYGKVLVEPSDKQTYALLHEIGLLPKV
jgi:glutaredoxin